MRRREGDGCPVAGALQMVGDKWTMLIVRDLAGGARRTTELLGALHPISSRTLVERLRDMERDQLVERRNLGGSPPHVEYLLTGRGRQLLPLLEALRTAGEALDCNACDDRPRPLRRLLRSLPQPPRPPAAPGPARPHARSRGDDSIVLL